MKDSLEEDSLMVALQISRILFTVSILILSLFYICLVWKYYMSSLNGWKVWILKDPRFGATNFLTNFIFLSYLLVYPEIVMCLACTSKKCEFWHPHLRGTTIVVLPNFFKFYPFICSCFEKFYQSRVSSSVLNFASLFEGNPFIFCTPKFCQIFSCLHFVYSENFISPA